MHPQIQIPVAHRIGGEPRIYDLDLADLLGLPEPTGIRNLIARHVFELQDRGDLYGRTVKYPSATRRPLIGMAHWLNEAQARFLRAMAMLPCSADILHRPARASVAPQPARRRRVASGPAQVVAQQAPRIVAPGGPVSGAVRTMRAAHQDREAQWRGLDVERRELDALRGTIRAGIDRDLARIERCLAIVDPLNKLPA